MSDHSGVYDLGEVNTESSPSRPVQLRPPPAPPPHVTRVAPRSVPQQRESRSNLAGSLSMFVPGSGQMIRGDFGLGLFFVSMLAFIATLGWAIVATLPRLTETLELLGHPSAAAAWFLAGLYVCVVLLHIGSVMSASPTWEFSNVCSAVHPAVAGSASAIFPGWGQVLNGDRRRAALFMTLVWVAGAAWLLVSPPAQHLLSELRLYLPEPVRIMTTPVARWTLPAVVWALAVYDAASRAYGRR